MRKIKKLSLNSLFPLDRSVKHGPSKLGGEGSSLGKIARMRVEFVAIAKAYSGAT